LVGFVRKFTYIGAAFSVFDLGSGEGFGVAERERERSRRQQGALG
jgi:hypothetical protein